MKNCMCCLNSADNLLNVDGKFRIKFMDVLGVEFPFNDPATEILENLEDSAKLDKEVFPLSSVKVEYLSERKPKVPKTKSPRQRKERLNFHRKELSKSCPICLKTFKNRRTIKDHIMRVHDKNNKSISCDRCDYLCYTKWEIQNHLLKQHLPRVDDPSILRVCPYCAKVMKGNNHLNSHIKMKHLKIVKFICDKCEFTTHGGYEIRRHMEVHHLPLASRKNFPCNVEGCISVLTTSGSLAIHKKLKHEKQKNHFCKLCGKRFALERLVTSHVQNVHLGVRPNPCSFKGCDKRFVNRNQLNSHVKRVHIGVREEVPPCPICGKTFTTKNHLQGHMKFHREPAFQCSYCSKKFFDKGKCNQHQDTTHLGKTYDCENCDKKFQSLRGWQRHVKSRHLIP